MSTVYDLDLRRKLSQLRVEPPSNGFDQRLRERVRATHAQRAQEAQLLELRHAPLARPRSRRRLGVAMLAVALAAAAAALLRLGPDAATPLREGEPTARAIGTPASSQQQPAGSPQPSPPDPATAPPTTLSAPPEPPPAPPRAPAALRAPAAPRATHGTSHAAPARGTLPRVAAAATPVAALPAALPAASPTAATPALRAIPRVDISDPPARPRSAADSHRAAPLAPERAGGARSNDRRSGDPSAARGTPARSELAPPRERISPAERERREAPRFELQDRTGPHLERESRGRGRR